jgi:hypothetical protein
MSVEMKPLPTELIDALLADYKRPEDLRGQNGLLKPLTSLGLWGFLGLYGIFATKPLQLRVLCDDALKNKMMNR